jgi:hypothetical protein
MTFNYADTFLDVKLKASEILSGQDVRDSSRIPPKYKTGLLVLIQCIRYTTIVETILARFKNMNLKEIGNLLHTSIDGRTLIIQIFLENVYDVGLGCTAELLHTRHWT